MSTIINATTTNGVVIQPDNSGSLVLQTNNGTTALTVDTSQNTTLAGKLTTASSGIQFSDASTQTAAASPYVLKNRIINGDMRIDQRNAGASVTASTTGAYALDRWYLEEATDGAATVQQVSDGPTGFTNSLKVTVTSTDTSIGASQYFEVDQNIEGFNTADLSFGTASASTITISFWVKSSLTGTFGGSIRNSAANRSYPFSYTINAANTWEKETITIAGDTTGTWIGATNGIGLRLTLALAAGSSLSGTVNTWAGANLLAPTGSTNLMGTASATWQITGVQLEIGTTATPFERRLYDKELISCQRYFCLIDSALGVNTGTTALQLVVNFPVQMRAAPSVAGTTLRVTDMYVADFTSSNPSPSMSNATTYGARINTSNFSGMTTGRATALIGTGTSAAPLQFSAEL
jgi:hypothetical protein